MPISPYSLSILLVYLKCIVFRSIIPRLHCFNSKAIAKTCSTISYRGKKGSIRYYFKFNLEYLPVIKFFKNYPVFLQLNVNKFEINKE